MEDSSDSPPGIIGRPQVVPFPSRRIESSKQLLDLKGRTSIPVLFGVRFPEDSWAHGPIQPAARQEELVNNNNNNKPGQ
ncbi:hypothetical protein TNCV_4071201 [Trichonephila clavipes]|nr:hypothetical protein TNCV_4071201 [Trichonephila clavipes]